jgi:acetyl/propionyl-CoA carboxylase alpha subunit
MFRRKKPTDAEVELQRLKEAYGLFRKDVDEFVAAATEDREEKAREIETLTRERDHYVGLLAEIRGSLSEVAAYEGMDVNQALVLYISEVVRDNAELEARIDAALFRIMPIDIDERTENEKEIARLLAGGERIS